MADNKNSAAIKKVSPYPIPVQLTGDLSFEAQIVQLAHSGFMVEVGGKIIQIHEKCQFRFTLPVLKKVVSGNAMVVKTFDQYVGRPDKPKRRIAELLFQSVEAGGKEAISSFLKAIKAKAP